MGGSRLNGVDFLKKEGEEVSAGKWTDIETLILVEIINSGHTSTNLESTNVDNICGIFNSVIKTASSMGLTGNLKSKQQVQSKLEHFQKHEKLNLLLLEEQLCSYIGQSSP